VLGVDDGLQRTTYHLLFTYFSLLNFSALPDELLHELDRIPRVSGSRTLIVLKTEETAAVMLV
jgi:hypothetical protein